MSQKDNSILKSTGIMTIATLLSRASGLLRMVAMAYAIATTVTASAYTVANNLPNAIYDLVAGGILSTAFLPVFLLEKERFGQKASDRFASNLLNLAIVILGLVAILAMLFAPQVMWTQTFTLGNQKEVVQLAIPFFRIFAIQLVFYGIGGVVTGVLNANRVYGLPAFSPAFNNFIVIASMLAYSFLVSSQPDLAFMVLAGGTTLGVIVQFVVQIPALVKIGFKYSFTINLRDPALKETLRIAAPTLIYIIGNLIVFSCRNSFSLSADPDSGASILSYAWMWYQLPYGVVAVSISTTFLTEMSDAVARNDEKTLCKHVKKGLRTTLFLIIPLASMMFILAPSIIQIYQAGAFNADDVNLVSNILRYWVISLPFYAGVMYIYRVFASLRQLITFALVSCGLCVVQVGLYALLCAPEILGLVGIPVADIVYFALMFFITAVILRKKIGSFGFSQVLVLCLKVALASTVGIALVFAFLYFIPFGQGNLSGLIQTIVGGLLGLVVTFGMCSLFRVQEMRVLTSLIQDFMRKGSRNSAEEEFEEILVSPCKDDSPPRNTPPYHGEGSKRPQLPAGKHARKGSWEAFEDEEQTERDSWNKLGKHAVGARRPYGNHNENRKAQNQNLSYEALDTSKDKAFLDPSTTSAIKARARHLQA